MKPIPEFRKMISNIIMTTSSIPNCHLIFAAYYFIHNWFRFSLRGLGKTIPNILFSQTLKTGYFVIILLIFLYQFLYFRATKLNTFFFFKIVAPSPPQPCLRPGTKRGDTLYAITAPR